MALVAKRLTIPQSLRFEVFKRDSFKCQYCGANAPDVLLHLDHIKAVVDGGTNDITNLVTACATCNLGKGRRPLSENSAVAKAKRQMDELQERREQLEMMMRWREGLLDVRRDLVESLASFWYRLAPGWFLSEGGMRELEKVTAKFSVEEITASMEAAASTYLRYGEDGKTTQESWSKAFSKLPAICTVKRDCGGDVGKEELYRVRGILRSRIPGFFDYTGAMKWLEAAWSWGITPGQILSGCSSASSWRKFERAIFELIETARGGEE